jgi:hypothetical protein
MDGYKWAEEHGYHESAAKVACEELANELKAENVQLKELLETIKGQLEMNVGWGHLIVAIEQALQEEES